MLGIMLGVGTLVVVMAVMDGFRHELLNRILALNGHLTLSSVVGPIKNYDQLADQVAELPGIKAVTPFMEGQALVISKGNAAGVYVRGLTSKGASSKQILVDGLTGDLNQFQGYSILIGKQLGEKLKVDVGDQLAVTISINDGDDELLQLAPKTGSFIVSGVFQMGMYDFDSSVILMPLATAQEFFETGDYVTSFEVATDQPEQINELKEMIWRDVDNSLSIRDWQQSSSGFLDTVKTQQSLVFIILTLIVVVAAFSIITGQVMMVNDKAGDIAILRTMGASRQSVLLIFLMSGAFVGIVGTVLGIIGGFLFAFNIETVRIWLEALTGYTLFDDKVYFLDQLPSLMKWQTIVFIGILSFVLAFLSSLYPAWRAARTDPIEALRYE